MKQIRRVLFCCALGIAILLGAVRSIAAQSSTASGKPDTAVSAKALEQQFFDAIRNADTHKVLSYVSKGGVNVGVEAQHTSQDQIEQEFRAHRGLYCKLFDSSCIQAPINLGNSGHVCSYRELLTHSEKVQTAASEMTRNGVQQAFLVARIKNDECPNQSLIDVVFNLEADGWRLFSIP